jgi:hypothetical protein
MKNLFLLSLFSIFLNAQNPIVYATLGDVIYDNVDKIAKLEYIPEYNRYKEDIKLYRVKVLAIKQYGYDIEDGKPNLDKKKYLQTLRELSLKNDFYLKDAQAKFKESIKTENSRLFNSIINTGLIDRDIYNEQIIAYYSKHIDDINSSKVTKDQNLNIQNGKELTKESNYATLPKEVENNTTTIEPVIEKNIDIQEKKELTKPNDDTTPLKELENNATIIEPIVENNISKKEIEIEEITIPKLQTIMEE